MEQTYERLGKPGIYRNDRFWLAGDHVVDPRVNEVPKVKALIDASERAKRVFKMTDYQGMNVRPLQNCATAQRVLTHCSILFFIPSSTASEPSRVWWSWVPIPTPARPEH